MKRALGLMLAVSTLGAASLAGATEPVASPEWMDGDPGDFRYESPMDPTGDDWLMNQELPDVSLPEPNATSGPSETLEPSQEPKQTAGGGKVRHQDAVLPLGSEHEIYN